MLNSLITLYSTELETRQLAQQIAEQFKFKYTETEPDETQTYLVLTQQRGLSLVMPHKKSLRVDFDCAALRLRRKQFTSKSLLAKAVGVKPNHRPTILDTTAGFGQDAFLLASLGCDVTMLERSPVMAALLQDGLARINAKQAFSNLQLTLRHQCGLTYFQQAHTEHDKPDVIYLDPMYPERKKTALNKQAMRLLKTLVGEDPDAARLFATAYAHAKRIVVKRPRLAAALSEQPIDISYTGNSTRYDVYLTN